MPLANGARLGVYEIVAPLGAGGMGEVYRARDTRLDRTVALKILPARFASRAELRERFEREARVVSNLNHPNICALYDVGQQDDVAFLVMEFIDGQTLADKLSRGPLPLELLLRYAIDITDALAKAHRHGIVHRDLKPGNVMIAKSGAKLLDFGLARRASESPAIAADAPTVHGTGPLTAEGTILGTLQYMSPEQLEGGEIDARSDLFSLGTLFYEMATGRRAFEASSHASLITKIMSEQPRPIRELQPVTPAALEQLIERCLQKDPEQRWQCAGDVAAELRAIASGAKAPGQISVRRKPVLAWSIAALMAILAAALLARLLTRETPAADTVRFAIGRPQSQASFATDALFSPIALSPDGREIAFVTTQDALRHIWLRRLDESRAKRLDETAGAYAPFWSPDGRSIGFFAGGKLLSIGRDGGKSQMICDTRSPAAAGTWSQDGTIVFASLGGHNGLFAVPAGGGTPRLLPSAPGSFGGHHPRFLPDGRRFFFSAVGVSKLLASTELWVGSTDPNEKPRLIAKDMNRVEYAAPWAVYARDGSLFAQKFNEEKLVLEGEPHAVAHEPYVYQTIGTSAHAAAKGTLALIPFPPRARLVRLTADGRESEEAAPPGDYTTIRLTRDGKRFATIMFDRRTGIGSLWIVDTALRTSTRASFIEPDHDFPVWSPDGQRLAFACDCNGPPHVFVKSAAAAEAEELLPPGAIQAPWDWTDDDRIFYSEHRADTGFDLFTISPSDRKPQAWLQTPANELYARVSPDGKWVSYTSDETGREEVYVALRARSDERVRVTTSGGRRSIWSRDGRTLFFKKGNNEVYAVAVTASADAWSAGDPKLLFALPSAILDYDVAPDGQFLAILDDHAATQSIEVVLNWEPREASTP